MRGQIMTFKLSMCKSKNTDNVSNSAIEIDDELPTKGFQCSSAEQQWKDDTIAIGIQIMKKMLESILAGLLMLIIIIILLAILLISIQNHLFFNATKSIDNVTAIEKNETMKSLLPTKICQFTGKVINITLNEMLSAVKEVPFSDNITCKKWKFSTYDLNYSVCWYRPVIAIDVINLTKFIDGDSTNETLILRLHKLLFLNAYLLNETCHTFE